ETEGAQRGDRRLRPQLQVGTAHHPPGRPARRDFERKDPASLMRLEHHFVLVGRAGGRDSLRYERVAPPAPCPAVEVVQYGPAPIALAGRRQRAGKLRAESE